MKKVFVFALVVMLVVFVSVSFAKKGCDPNKMDPNAPKDPNASKLTGWFSLAEEPNKAEPNAPKEPNASKLYKGLKGHKVKKAVDPNKCDPNAHKDPNAPK